MKITVLSTQNDNKSYFTTEKIQTPICEPLGYYSIPFSSPKVQFREFKAGLIFPMHNAPRIQYIVYLEGSVQVRCSGGETKIFSAGDILLVKDINGEGHESITIRPGKAVIISLDEEI